MKPITMIFIALLFVGCVYEKDVNIRFEGEDEYHVSQWIWYGFGKLGKQDAICMKLYDVKTKNVDSLYNAVMLECDSIIVRHKRMIENY